MKLFLFPKFLLVALYLICISSTAKATDMHPLLKTLAIENHFALIRHALAPGNGDPTNFDVTDCSTQRNLSDTGRSQAVTIGKTLRVNGIEQAAVYTSQWCRCQDTARLLGYDTPAENPILNSFYRKQDRRQQVTHDLEQWLLGITMETPLILVSHQVNITAFTGVYPSSGDMVIVRRNEDATFSVLGVVSTH